MDMFNTDSKEFLTGDPEISEEGKDPEIDGGMVHEPASGTSRPGFFDHLLVEPDILKLYAVLFAAGEPMATEKVASAIGISAETLSGLLATFRGYLQRLTPCVLVETDDKIGLATRPAFSDIIINALGTEGKKKRLSGQALETLAIIAYRQPVMKSEIDRVRGSDSESTLGTLLASGLIRARGDARSGAPLLYETTEKFLISFGIRSLMDLPPLESFSDGMGM